MSDLSTVGQTQLGGVTGSHVCNRYTEYVKTSTYDCLIKWNGQSLDDHIEGNEGLYSRK
jgi:hypothetical protein